ncbi:hypothetical protein [Chitinophaga rhizosphaerae]|uniref:hypothetical protein n=1 Tax=Chitinophaga rhizosphaerae TaxID=1864947 RepID=UPI000F7FF174|nr:hypothetical protein [Chitinophaga rhizosphaerae]
MAEINLGKYPGKEVRKIKLVNRNRKKNNNVFFEINFAPVGLVPERFFADTIFAVSWDDGTITYTKMIDLYRLPFERISSAFTLPSHCMVGSEFKRYWLGLHPTTHGGTEMAVYVYQHIEFFS